MSVLRLQTEFVSESRPALDSKSAQASESSWMRPEFYLYRDESAGVPEQYATKLFVTFG
jgi:hypothetical protein